MLFFLGNLLCWLLGFNDFGTEGLLFDLLALPHVKHTILQPLPALSVIDIGFSLGRDCFVGGPCLRPLDLSSLL